MNELRASEIGVQAPNHTDQVGRDQGPAETSTREDYASQMRDGSPGQRGADVQARAGPEAREGAQPLETRDLAEPRSRAEVADEARGQLVRSQDGLSPDGRGTVAQTPTGRFSVVEADRTLGDTTPTGIGLKPGGEQLRDMESDKLSRAARFRREFYREAQDIQDVSEKNANELSALLGPHPPAGHAETVALPALEATSPPPADAGSIATAGLALGLLADRVIHWAADALRRPKG